MTRVRISSSRPSQSKKCLRAPGVRARSRPAPHQRPGTSKKSMRIKLAGALGVGVESVTPASPTVSRNPLLVEQYDLPVTFDQSGKTVTLEEMLQMGSLALSLSSLTPKQLVELTTLRIAAQPKFEVMMVGAGLVDKARALQEVAAQTDVGRLLVEVEQRTIQRVLKRATP